MNNVEPPPQKPSSTQQTINQRQVYYKCGCDGHWSRTCRTTKHLVEAYRRMQKDKRGKAPQGESHHTCFPEANMTMNVDNVLPKANMTLIVDNNDFLKIDLEDFGDNE